MNLHGYKKSHKRMVRHIKTLEERLDALQSERDWGKEKEINKLGERIKKFYENKSDCERRIRKLRNN